MHLPDADTQAATALACSDLVDMLDELYPEQSPDPRDDERTVWMKAGKRELVRSLLQLKATGRMRRL
jgi:hypothetical protein